MFNLETFIICANFLVSLQTFIPYKKSFFAQICFSSVSLTLRHQNLPAPELSGKDPEAPTLAKRAPES